MREGISASNVVDKECSGCSTIVGTSDALERLLACGVPYLQLDVLVVDLNCAGAELNTDGQVVLLAEPFVGELEQKA